MFFVADFLRPTKRDVVGRHTTPKSTQGNRKQVVPPVTLRELPLQPPRDECSGPGRSTDLTVMRAIFSSTTYCGASLPKVRFGGKFCVQMVVLAFAINLLCSGCGTGMTVVAAMEGPTISQVSPQVVTAGTPSVTVTVQGANFQSQAALTVNGTAVPTTVVNSTTLAANISGSPLAQPAVAQLQVKNTNGGASNQVPLTVTSAPDSQNSLSISTTQLASAQVGVSYKVSLAAAGGTQPYKWSVSSGSLPSGLTMSNGGVISGTPSVSGTFTFGVTVTDSSSKAQNKTVTFSIVVAPVQTAPTALSIGSGALSAGAVGVSYAVSLNVSGGTPGYTWSLASGKLPAGLALSSAGVISGTPTASGTSTFAVAVQDSGSPVQKASASESITVSAAPPGKLTITTTGLAAGKNGSSYSASLNASGGTPGYTWSIASGSLPAGLTLSSAGVISGTPTGSGISTFTVGARDSGSPAQTASGGESITVSAAPSKLTITTTGLAAGKNGTSYSASLSASGGTPGYTWSIASGSLPAGLTLSSAGVISGTPTGSGTSTFTVGVQDSGSPAQTASVSESITVSAAPSTLTITSANLSAAQTGSSYTATLSATGGTPGYTWSVSAGKLPAGLSLSSGGVISGTPTKTGTSSFTVTVTDSASPAQTASRNGVDYGWDDADHVDDYDDEPDGGKERHLVQCLAERDWRNARLHMVDCVGEPACRTGALECRSDLRHADCKRHGYLHGGGAGQRIACADCIGAGVDYGERGVEHVDNYVDEPGSGADGQLVQHNAERDWRHTGIHMVGDCGQPACRTESVERGCHLRNSHGNGFLKLYGDRDG